MSNPWSEAYKKFREESLEEARKLKDVQTAGTQGKYDLKSKVAKMRQEGKSEMEIKQWLDRYLQNSKLPGEQKATMRSNALQSESVVDEGILDFFNRKDQDNVRKGTYHKDSKNKKGTIFSNVSKRNEMLRKARGEEAFPTGEVVSEGPEEYAGGQHPSKSPNKKDRDRYETERRRSEAPKGVGVPDKSVGYGQLKQSFEPEGEMVSEDPVQDYRDRRRAAENRSGARGPEFSHGPNPTGMGTSNKKPDRANKPATTPRPTNSGTESRPTKPTNSGTESRPTKPTNSGTESRPTNKPDPANNKPRNSNRLNSSVSSPGYDTRRIGGYDLRRLSNSFEPEGELVDESGYFPTPESQRKDYEKHKPNLSTGELPGRHKPVKRNPDGSLKREEVQLVSEAEERVLVRITTEDGRVFEKKVPKDKISELRQRYKSVVEVGSSDSKPKMTSKQAGSDMKESKDKPKRWWDDDGDGVGYEEGEVSGKFKRKKKTKKESYSDWRSDMDLSEEQLGVSPREMRSQGNEKKK